VLNRSRFWSHEGTEAAKLEQVHGKETKKRSSHITSVFDYVAFENNKKWKNWEGYILIEEKGKDNSFVGRNPSYKPVVVMGEFEVGDKVKVRIRKITVHYLIAEVMQ
jgi:tRNA A37 methylthiotransferase MiaB